MAVEMLAIPSVFERLVCELKNMRRKKQDNYHLSGAKMKLCNFLQSLLRTPGWCSRESTYGPITTKNVNIIKTERANKICA